MIAVLDERPKLTPTIRAILDEYENRRFQIAEVVADVYAQHNLGYLDQVGDTAPLNLGGSLVRTHITFRVNQVLEERDHEGRVWFHSVDRKAGGKREWFHNSIATPEEEQRFGQYLIDECRGQLTAGRYHVRHGRARAKQERKVA